MNLNISASIKAVLITVVSVFFAIFILPWALIGLGIMLEPNPPEPAIKYAEFPFEVVYEIDDEIVTVNDIYVCEYDGIGMNEGVGKYRKWKGYIKSSGKEELILLEDGDLKLACSVGYPEYYMGDPSKLNPEEYTPYMYYIKSNSFGGISSGVMDIEPILEQYRLKLISWKLSKPIQNSFNNQKQS